MIPQRSTKGKAALDVFFDGHNDVHFYVEDTAYQNIYQAILRRLFPKIAISQIFPLDGKPNVLRHAQDSGGNSVLSKPRVYILDKDFDDLLGTVVKLPGVFYLRRYCIENYLLEDERAVVEFVVEQSPKLPRVSVTSRLRYTKTMQSCVAAADPLFRLFLLVQAHRLGLPNASQPPERFVGTVSRERLDRGKVAAYRRAVLDALRSGGVIKGAAELASACGCAFPSAGASDAHISGKFLLGMLSLTLRSRKLVGNVDRDVMLYSLARNARPKSLRELGTRIRRFLRDSLPGNSATASASTSTA